MSKQSDIETRLKQAHAALSEEPIVLTPYETIKLEKQGWEDRANWARKRMAEITQLVNNWQNRDRYSLPVQQAQQKAAEISLLLAEADICRDIVSAAQSKSQRLDLELQGIAHLQGNPRVMEYRFLKVRMRSAYERLDALGSMPFGARSSDWQAQFDAANDEVAKLSRELDTYSDIANEEDLRERMRQG